MRWRTRTNGRTERGAAAVEFALVIFPLLMVLFGIINFGYAFAQQIALDNAARQGARYAVVDHGAPCGAIEAHAQDSLWFTGATYDLQGETGTCARPCAGSVQNGTDLTVELSYTSEPLIPLPLPSFGFPGFGDLDMTGLGVFRCEYT